MDRQDFEHQAMVAAQDRLEHAIESSLSMADIREFLEGVVAEIQKRQMLAEQEVLINRVFLEGMGTERTEIGLIIHTIEDAHASAVDSRISVDDVIRLIAPSTGSSKRVTGDALLKTIARGIVERQAPLNFTEMIEYLDEKGIERPGANYRNNLISMVTKSPHIFQRAGRGVYDVTLATRAEVLAEMRKENQPS